MEIGWSGLPFGSYARKKFGEESDLDVLVIGNVKLDEVIMFPILFHLNMEYTSRQ
ncbi:MAG: nucleotidyltransferase domain-containing protein [Archaeoglobus sp.]|uniref:nucleotidyltransferase domain-containing protein n=1 Tax=Archaeoglobus sp. TaxID=1872626 RepID=UPI001D7E5071|nr:nucleotidyltransferase domain-containing protein [Archaeoglobus sp.]